MAIISSFFGLQQEKNVRAAKTAEGRFSGKGSERRKSLRRKSKKEHRKCKSLKGSERRKSKLRLSTF